MDIASLDGALFVQLGSLLAEIERLVNKLHNTKLDSNFDGGALRDFFFEITLEIDG